MATIDAAIIKALVEHIGGNPDTIPDGPISGGTTCTCHSKVYINWETLEKDNTFYFQTDTNNNIVIQTQCTKEEEPKKPILGVIHDTDGNIIRVLFTPAPSDSNTGFIVFGLSMDVNTSTISLPCERNNSTKSYNIGFNQPNWVINSQNNSSYFSNYPISGDTMNDTFVHDAMFNVLFERIFK